MNRIIRIIITLALAMLIILPVFARTATTPDFTGRKWDMKWHDINQLNMTVTNYGIFGHNVLLSVAGGYWPAGFPAENYVYGCGIWFGALVDTSSDSLTTKYDTLVTCGYNPNSGAGEFVPGDGSDTPLYSRASEVVYVSTNEDWNTAIEGKPDTVVSMQDSWCEYSDLDVTQHFTPDNVPLELMVRQTGYAWVGPLKEDMIFLTFEIQNARKDGKDLENCYMGVAADLDIGNESGTSANDLLGFIDTMTVDYSGVTDTLMQINVGYQFQLDSEGGWAHEPALVAFKYMKSPVATQEVDVYHDGSVIIYPGQDTLDIGGDIVIKDREIGMTTFNYFTIDTDPATKEERYQVLAGYNHQLFNPGNPENSFSPFPVWGEGTPGYPGQSQNESTAGDKRFVMASGPFSLKNDSTTSVIIAVYVARDAEELLDKALTAQDIYDKGWLGPVAPEMVNFNTIGLDKTVMLYWDDASEKVSDRYFRLAGDTASSAYNPAYREYDVEGYNVYRSRTGAGGSWELLAKFDKINEYVAVVRDSLISMDNVSGDMETLYYYDTVGANTGIPYFYMDDNLTNGITYYYMITAYDVNFLSYNMSGTTVKPAQPLILESAGRSKAGIPRTVPVTYTASSLDSIVQTKGLCTSDVMELSVVTVLDTLVDKIADKVFTLKFEDIVASRYPASVVLPAYVYSVYDEDGDKVNTGVINLDTLTVVEGNSIVSVWAKNQASALTQDGYYINIDNLQILKSTWPSNENSTAAVSIVTGSYNDSLYPVKTEYAGQAFFRGTLNYRLTWHEVVDGSDTSLTLTVLDVDNDMEVPFGNDVIGNVWHFNYLASATTDQNVEYITSTSPASQRSGMYLPGFRMYFNRTGRILPINWADRPKDGDVWEIAITMNDDALPIQYPPFASEFEYSFSAHQFSEATKDLLDNVKVVPNPYVVRSEYDLDYRYRKIYFTNLPEKCTINIYTISGDLVSTIEHDVAFYTYTSTGDSSLVYDYADGIASWNVLTDNDQIPAPGLYIYHIEAANGASKVGKFAIIK